MRYVADCYAAEFQASYTLLPSALCLMPYAFCRPSAFC